MNNRLTVESCAVQPGSLVSDVCALEPRARVDELYRASLQRKPITAERERALAFFRSSQNLQEASGDLLWSLLNSAEFRYNH